MAITKLTQESAKKWLMKETVFIHQAKALLLGIEPSSTGNGEYCEFINHAWVKPLWEGRDPYRQVAIEEVKKIAKDMRVSLVPRRFSTIPKKFDMKIGKSRNGRPLSYAVVITNTMTGATHRLPFDTFAEANEWFLKERDAHMTAQIVVSDR